MRKNRDNIIAKNGKFFSTVSQFRPKLPRATIPFGAKSPYLLLCPAEIALLRCGIHENGCRNAHVERFHLRIL